MLLATAMTLLATLLAQSYGGGSAGAAVDLDPHVEGRVAPTASATDRASGPSQPSSWSRFSLWRCG
jgi:hypothetical protein